jgi:uncharacterized membrane protein
MATGPVEYLIVAFPNGKVSEEVATELGDLVDRKLIRILDIVFITKDLLGEVSTLEFDELDQVNEWVEIDAEVGGLIGLDDASFAAAELEPGAAAAVLLVEDLWAARLADAVTRAGGILHEGARIPSDLIEDALAALPA